MRATFSVLVVACAIGATTSASGSTAHPCPGDLPRGPAVPAAVILSSTCGTFRLATDGRVERLPRHWLARHGGGTGRRFGAHLRLRSGDGRIHVLRGKKTVWRSTGTYRNDITSVAFGPGLFAFSAYRRGVYLTDLRTPERLVVAEKTAYPFDFIRGGRLLVLSGRSILLVSTSGNVVRRLVYSPNRGLGLDARSDALYVVTPGDILVALRGTRMSRVASVAGIDGWLSLAEPDLLVFGAKHAITVTTRRAEVVASARWQAKLGGADLGVQPSPDGMLFAFRVTTARPGGRNEAARVFVLQRGEHELHELFRHRLAQVGCGIGGNLSWHGHDLLYDSGQGRALIFDADDAARLVSLSALERQLERRAPFETTTAVWASAYDR